MTKVQITSLALIFALLTICKLVPQVSALGEPVGGKQEIENLKGNKEIQDMGKFCVDKHNEGVKGNGGQPLTFSEVVRAEKQVVSGIKYFLTIAAASGGAAAVKTFDAEVLVKPGSSEMEMTAFGPANMAMLA